MRSGDMPVGLALVKRSVMAAERAGQTSVSKEDIMASFEVSRYVHMSAAIKALSIEERTILGHIAILLQGVRTFLTTGAIFEYVNL
ncbi:MAG: hypothetical protein NTW33_02080 [Methanoregula sp.]|nr:hypothetical protein [Methanoregula sp.]